MTNKFKNFSVERIYNIMVNDLNKEDNNFYTAIDNKGNDYIMESKEDINNFIKSVNTEDIVYISCDHGYTVGANNNYVEDSESGIIRYNSIISDNHRFNAIKYKEYVTYIRSILNQYNVTDTERSIKP